jgi:hypothetical protein
VMRLRNFRPESASSLTKPHHSCSRPTAYEEGRCLVALALASIPAVAEPAKVAQGTAADLGVMSDI